MIVLTIRTDRPTAEIGLFQGGDKIAYHSWEAHRKLAETIHHKIDELLKMHNYSVHDIEGIIMYEGPGSFTGLRIGLSVGNALSYSLSVPAIGTSGEDWVKSGIALLNKYTDNIVPVLPKYGSDVHITKQRK